MRRLTAIGLLALAACSTPAPPGIEVHTVEVPVEVLKPCPGIVPERPAPLARPLPDDANALAALLASKLVEWSGQGMYGDRAEAYFRTCAPGE